METITKHCGCLPCLLVGYLDVHTSIEHVTEHGRRVGNGPEVHQWTLGLCTWHHFGFTHNHSTRHQMAGEFGPPLPFGRKAFEAYFGDELTVLVPVQDRMLERFADNPWPEYNVPRQIARDTRTHWIQLNHAAHSQSTKSTPTRSAPVGRNTD